MWRKCKNLDERQLWIRGNVFQHTLILLFVLLMIDGFLKEEGFILAQGMWGNMLLLWIAFTLCFCEFIIREINPMGQGMSIFYITLGAAGAFMLVSSLLAIFTRREPFAVGITLTRCGAAIFAGGMMIFIFLVFLGKKCYNHWKESRGGEE